MPEPADEQLEWLADQLVTGDENLLDNLRAMRRSAGITVATVASRMGVSTATVEAFEGYDANPRLSEIRRYAMSVHAVVAHAVLALPEVETGEDDTDGDS